MIKITLFTLIVILICVISMSYYFNKEGFEDLTSSLTNAIQSAEGGISRAEGAAMAEKNAIDGAMNKTIMGGAIGPLASAPPPNTAVSGQQSEIVVSGPGFNAMSLQQKTDLLKDIQQLVKNEIIAQRQTTPISTNQESSDESESTQQGKEFNKSCKKSCEGPCPRNKDGTCPPVPDMSQYIRKDQIPCWNCSLDY
jgi:predicted extracellular nuclease